MKLGWWLLLSGLAAAPPAALAQQGQDIDSLLANEKKLLITPFAAPGYTPEQGGLISIGALISLRTNPGLKSNGKHELVQRSTFTFNGSYSTTGAINLNGDLSSFWKGDNLRIYGKFGYKDMPDSYWGVGYEAGKAPEVDSVTGYHRDYWIFQPKVLVRISSKAFIGGLLDFNSTTASDVSPGVAADPYFQEFGPSNRNSGVGAVFQLDTRDVGANAWRGMYLNAQATFYGNWLGGDNTYQIYEVDYRQYKQITRPGRTLAWTARARLGYGAVPWAELSQVGGSNDLRGYRMGRYRDKAMMTAMVEYRHQFLNAKRKGGMSRHGYVGWVGFGTISEEFLNRAGWLPNWGIGYRFEVQPRMSVRIDVGFGREFLDSGDKFVSAVYFSFAEAF